MKLDPKDIKRMVNEELDLRGHRGLRVSKDATVFDSLVSVLCQVINKAIEDAQKEVLFGKKEVLFGTADLKREPQWGPSPLVGKLKLNEPERRQLPRHDGRQSALTGIGHVPAETRKTIIAQLDSWATQGLQPTLMLHDEVVLEPIAAAGPPAALKRWCGDACCPRGTTATCYTCGKPAAIL